MDGDGSLHYGDREGYLSLEGLLNDVQIVRNCNTNRRGGWFGKGESESGRK